MSERLTCIATEHRVIRGDRRPLPCGRPACAMRDGRPYCRDHDPDAGVLRAGRRRRRTRRALERELEALRAQRSLDVDMFLAAMDRLRAAELHAIGGRETGVLYEAVVLCEAERGTR